MRKNIHPIYRGVVVRDVSTGTEVLVRSTVETNETTKWKDGEIYPLLSVEISSDSHPFYRNKDAKDGKMQINKCSRIDKYYRKFNK